MLPSSHVTNMFSIYTEMEHKNEFYTSIIFAIISTLVSLMLQISVIRELFIMQNVKAILMEI